MVVVSSSSELTEKLTESSFAGVLPEPYRWPIFRVEIRRTKFSGPDGRGSTEWKAYGGCVNKNFPTKLKKKKTIGRQMKDR